MKNLLVLIVSIFTFSNASAAGLALDNITEEQFNKITEEFGANFVHTAVTPPNSLGALFGVEVGLVGGLTESPETDKVVKSVSPSSTVSNIPHAGIMAQVSVPFGISAEAVMFPETEVSDLSLSVLTMAAKWTLTQSLIKLPLVDIAARVHFGSSEASYKTTTDVSSVPVDSSVKFDSSSWGTNLSVGLNLMLVKPYVGLGYVSTSTELAVDATSGTIFDNSFTTGRSAKKDHSGAHMFIGAELDLFVIHLAAEYSNVFGIGKYTAKFSLAF